MGQEVSTSEGVQDVGVEIPSPDASNLQSSSTSEQQEPQIEEEKIEELLNPVKECFDGVQTCIEEKAYEGAVAHIQNFYRVILLTVEDVDDVYIELIESVEEKLKRLVRAKLDAAMENKNLSEIERFCALHAGLGMNDEAIPIYRTQYIEEIIKSEGILTMDLLNAYIELKDKPQPEIQIKEWKEGEEMDDEDEKYFDFVDATRKFYEFLAGLLEEKKDFIVAAFGQEALNVIGADLIRLADVYASPIFDRFLSYMKIQEMIVRIKMQKMAMDEDTHQGETIDPRTFTEILGQMSILSQSNELFDKFFFSRIKIPKQMQQRHRYVKEIMTYYNIIEEYFMTESFKKAINNDKQDPGSKTSSLVENSFFVLKQSAHRALATSNCQSACALINMLSNILNYDYRKLLETMLHESFEEGIRWNPRMILNNVQVSTEYVEKLRISLDSEAQKLYAGSDKEIEMIRTCLIELANISRQYNSELLLPYMQEVVSRLDHIISNIFISVDYSKATYDIDEERFQMNEINDPFMEQLIIKLHDLISQYKESFTENNFGILLSLILDFICDWIEKGTLKKTFSMIGAMQFKKEVKMLTEYCTSQTTKPIRQKFSRLSLISFLLNVTHVGLFSS
eukprot:TRINITY_DN6305_c1_g2_i2.p1 TRINITY_DN6305_c1_g2~~TRINITY_DN6305_c1_g2_i2.p1  ORF type:complete len:656 (+),score=188.46 TRINITY_DN6305_c1_g2_i2:101-1969(+)